MLMIENKKMLKEIIKKHGIDKLEQLIDNDEKIFWIDKSGRLCKFLHFTLLVTKEKLMEVANEKND